MCFRLWALAIYSGNDESGLEHNTMYAIFSVTLMLTPAGLEHISEVTLYINPHCL